MDESTLLLDLPPSLHGWSLVASKSYESQFLCAKSSDEKTCLICILFNFLLHVFVKFDPPFFVGAEGTLISGVKCCVKLYCHYLGR
jgi:hypothetical protein